MGATLHDDGTVTASFTLSEYDKVLVEREQNGARNGFTCPECSEGQLVLAIDPSWRDKAALECDNEECGRRYLAD